jgi:hypothetical protein
MATSDTTVPGTVETVALDRIDVPDRFNPRSDRDKAEFAQLVASVRRHGVLRPVLFAPADKGRFPAGRRRGSLPRRGWKPNWRKFARSCARPNPETDSLELALIETSRARI